MENSCLFDEQMDPPGKFMSVRGTNGPLLENYKNVAPGKKNRYLISKTVSVAASANNPLSGGSTQTSHSVCYYNIKN